MFAMRGLLFERLLSNLPLSPRELRVLVDTAPYRYKDHYIEKRKGRGLRLISQPTSELKLVQRLLVSSELSELPVSKQAMAYVRGRSIYSHAELHSGNHFLLKMDFRDFFPSITPRLLESAVEQLNRFNETDLSVLSNLLFRFDRTSKSLRLSIGAPSSPHLSNVVMLRFDEKISEYCHTQGVIYSRYADDLAFSTDKPRTLDEVAKYVENACHTLLGMQINGNKTINVSRKYQRTLTGLVLGNDGSVSISRAERRELRARVHRVSLGYDERNIAGLCGKLSFVYSIDSEFVEKTLSRFGFKSIKDLRGKLEN